MAVTKAAPAAMVAEALEKRIVTAEEAELLRSAEEARNDAIQVDSFDLEEYLRGAAMPAEAAHPVA